MKAHAWELDQLCGSGKKVGELKIQAFYFCTEDKKH